MLPTAALAMTVLTGGFGSPHWTTVQAWYLPGPGLSVTPQIVFLPKRVLAVCDQDGGLVSVTFFFADPLREGDPCTPSRTSSAKRVWLDLFLTKPPPRPECGLDPAEGARAIERIVTGY